MWLNSQCRFTRRVTAILNSQHRIDMLELPGQFALSDFRLAKLLKSLQRRDDRVKSVTARFSYFVAATATLTTQQKQRLDALLLSGDKPGKLGKGARTIHVVPRPGTISPWSSKATDIARACDLDVVERIERGICYGIQINGEVSDDEFAALGSVLFDRMTEALLDSGDKAIALFETHKPAPLTTVDLAKGGREALVQANTDLGLALSGQEIDYLVESYAGLDRNPSRKQIPNIAGTRFSMRAGLSTARPGTNNCLA